MRHVLHLMEPARPGGRGATRVGRQGRMNPPAGRAGRHATACVGTKSGASGPGFSYRSDAGCATWGEVPSLFAQGIASVGVLNVLRTRSLAPRRHSPIALPQIQLGSLASREAPRSPV